MPLLLKTLRPGAGVWDHWAAHRSAVYVANASVIKKRIENVYGRRTFRSSSSASVDLKLRGADSGS